MYGAKRLMAIGGCTLLGVVLVANAAAPPNPMKEAYFGEQHIHTAYSLDAFIGGTRITPFDAYRFRQRGGGRGQRHQAQAQPPARLGGDHRPCRVHRRDVFDVHRRCAGARPAADPEPARDDRPEAAAGVVHEIRRGQQPRRSPAAPGVLRGPRHHAQRLEERHGRGGRAEQRPRQVHRLHRVRMDRRAEGREPAPQRDLSRRQRARHADERLRNSSRRGAVGLAGRSRKTGHEAAGDSAQFEREQDHHVRLDRRFGRQAVTTRRTRNGARTSSR